MEAGGVESSHISKAHDDYGRKWGKIGGHFGQFFGGPEEKRSVTPQNGNIRRDLFMLQSVWAFVPGILLRDRHDGGRLPEPVAVEQGGANPADLDRYRESGQHSQ